MCDRDDSGSITYDEFLVGIRGVLNPRRKALVAMAFDVLDKDKSGEVTIDDVREAYDATGHPDVLRGARTLEQVLEVTPLACLMIYVPSKISIYSSRS